MRIPRSLYYFYSMIICWKKFGFVVIFLGIIVDNIVIIFSFIIIIDFRSFSCMYRLLSLIFS